jgi:FkbM family methyltransferase
MNAANPSATSIERLIRRVVPRPILSLRFRLPWLRRTESYARAPLRTLLAGLRFTIAECLRREVVFRGPDNLVVTTMPNNFSSFAFCVDGSRDADIWRFIRQRLRPGATFIDVGANIGTYALPAALLVGPTGHVVAVEAHPLTYSFLRRNTIANGLGQITPLHLALGEAPGMVTMNFEPTNPGETHVATTPDGGTGGTVAVAVRRLDDVLAERGISHVDYIKIDVEGFELAVLRGAIGTLAANPDIVVQTELVARHAARYGHGIDAIAELLHAIGLRPHHVDPATGEPRPAREPLAGDVLWIRA